MNGIDKITGRIAQDAQAEAQRILAQAAQEAQVIQAQRAEEAQRAADQILADGKAAAAVREERMESMAALEGRKLVLEEKQKVLDEAFSLALERLRSLERAEYAKLLSRLLTAAVVTGREEVIMNPADRTQVGKEVVSKANEAVAHGAGMLTLSAETRDIPGGFILADGPVEINCALDTLLAEQRARLTPEVAGMLFGKG